MLSWLFPTCPIDPFEQAWIERRFAWLIEQFGADQLRQMVMVERTEEFFPEAYGGEPEDAIRLFNQTIERMGVPAGSLAFEILPDDNMPAAAGHYDPEDRTIRLAASQLDSPDQVVATLAHELCHELLLGGGKLTGEEWDHEWTTDLAAVFFGHGIFTANATIQEGSGHAGVMSFWSMRRTGYLPSRMFGYALALFAWLRDEPRPKWRRFLRLDAAHAFTHGLRYLQRKGDCLLDPTDLRIRHKPAINEVTYALQNGSPAARIHAAWDATEFQLHSEALIAGLQKNLSHGSSMVRAEMAKALGEQNDLSDATLHALRLSFSDSSYRVRCAVADAIAKLKPNDPDVVDALAQQLSDEDNDVVTSVAAALAAYGDQAAPYERQTMRALRDALVDCDFPRAEALIETARQICTDPGQAINLFFMQVDPELRRIAIDALHGKLHEEEVSAPAASPD